MSAGMEIKPTWIRPESREDWLAIRKRFVGASEAAALFAVHPHTTAYELWARKRDRLPVTQETAAMFWGGLLEDDVLTAVARQCPDWTITPNVIPGGMIATDEVNRLAATPDAFALDPQRGRGVIQVKTTNPRTFKRHWHDEDGAVEIPLWIAIQANLEAHLAGVHWADVAVFVIGDYGNHRVEILNVPLEPSLIEKLETEAVRFCDLVESGIAPDPEYGRDLDVIKRLARDEPTIPEAFDLSGDNEFQSALAAYQACGDDMRALKESREVHEAKIRHALGGHELASAGSYRITNKLTHKKGFYVEPTSFRTLRITERTT